MKECGIAYLFTAYSWSSVQVTLYSSNYWLLLSSYSCLLAHFVQSPWLLCTYELRAFVLVLKAASAPLTHSIFFLVYVFYHHDIYSSKLLFREGRTLSMPFMSFFRVCSSDDILIKKQGGNYVVKKVTIRTSTKSDGKSKTSCRSCWTKTLGIKGN